ncbi:hypothetical protein SESBI_06303 [Sesbania bispinosa]|nr:hypothetical protein SESBI_06303 [Sesbania bispinosa]
MLMGRSTTYIWTCHVYLCVMSSSFTMHGNKWENYTKQARGGGIQTVGNVHAPRRVPLCTLVMGFFRLHQGNNALPFNSTFSIMVKGEYDVKVEISDGNDTTYLSLGDDDVNKLLRVSCKDLISTIQDPHTPTHPPIFNSLIGKRMLFLVKKKMHQNFKKGVLK